MNDLSSELPEVYECVDCTVAMTMNLSPVELLKSRLRDLILRDWYVCCERLEVVSLPTL